MRVQVRLFATLGNDFPDHDPLKGFAVDIHENATIADLMDHLEIQPKVGMVTVNRQLEQSSHILKTDDVVRVFRPIFGG